MIKITAEMKKTSDERYNEVCRTVDYYIESAVKRGENYAIFGCDAEADRDVYSGVRKAYEREGYIIKPYGYDNGVWQKNVELICW